MIFQWLFRVFSNSMIFPCMELFWWFSRFSMISRACGNPVTLNFLSHIWHWNYGFKWHLFMCVTKWALRLLLTLNLRSQIWHWNGRAPVCILSWLSKSLRRAKAFPQKAQVYLFCASCWSRVSDNKNSLKPEIWNIRIYHECEGRIEKPVPRIAVWHHEACRDDKRWSIIDSFLAHHCFLSENNLQTLGSLNYWWAIPWKLLLAAYGGWKVL